MFFVKTAPLIPQNSFFPNYSSLAMQEASHAKKKYWKKSYILFLYCFYNIEIVVRFGWKLKQNIYVIHTFFDFWNGLLCQELNNLKVDPGGPKLVIRYIGAHAEGTKRAKYKISNFGWFIALNTFWLLWLPKCIKVACLSLACATLPQKLCQQCLLEPPHY